MTASLIFTINSGSSSIKTSFYRLDGSDQLLAAGHLEGIGQEQVLSALPRRFAEKGVRRYGFHGLSYEYILEELATLAPAAAQGKLIIAHLGSGASMAAVRGGHCIDTSMGLSPLGGLVMATRCGDL